MGRAIINSRAAKNVGDFFRPQEGRGGVVDRDGGGRGPCTGVLGKKDLKEA